MMWRWLGGLALLVLILLATLGVRGRLFQQRPIMVFSDMDVQPKYTPQDTSRFFADGRAARRPPPGTVAYGGGDFPADAGAPQQNADFLQEDTAYYQGRDEDGQWIERNPVAIEMPLLRQGQTAYEIHCTVCHGATGQGNGITTQYGFSEVANLLVPRIRSMPDGQVYGTITNGKGLMVGYEHQIRPADRWAIVAYLRALQLSQNTELEDVPEPRRGELIDES